MENWMIPIAIALSFGCVHRMIISIPPTSDVEWMKTVKAKMPMNISSFVSHRPFAHNPFVAVSFGAESVNELSELFASHEPSTYRPSTNIRRSGTRRRPSIGICSRRDKQRSNWVRHFHRLARRCHRCTGKSSWKRCMAGQKLLSLQNYQQSLLVPSSSQHPFTHLSSLLLSSPLKLSIGQPISDSVNIPTAVASAVKAIQSATFLAESGNLTEMIPVMRMPTPIMRMPNVPDMKFALCVAIWNWFSRYFGRKT